MIVGNGVDIVEVARIAQKLSKGNGFRDKVFSTVEIAYCEQHAIPSESYAARFAAKEAFVKAAGKGFLLGYELNEIEIVNDADGKPFINLYGSFRKFFDDNQWKSIHVSLTHSAGIACAFVIIEK